MRGDVAAWDERYDTAEFVWSSEPNRFLPPEVETLEPGTALDLACGEGRNAVWLAGQGWEVTAVDFSEVGLDKGRRLAASEGVEVDWQLADATSFDVEPRFDLVVVFYLQLPPELRRASIGRATRALREGGTLLIVGHDVSNLTDGVGGPQDPSVLFNADELRADVEAAGVGGIVVERAQALSRPVETDGGTAVAIDCLLRAHRPPSHRPDTDRPESHRPQ